MKKVKILFACSGICLFFSLLYFYILIFVPGDSEEEKVTESNTTEYTGTVRNIASDREGYKIQLEEHDIALFVSFDWDPDREVLQKLKTGDKIFYRLYIVTFDDLKDFGSEQTPIVMLKTGEETALSLEDFNDFWRRKIKQTEHFVFTFCLILFLGAVFLFVSGFMVRKREKGGVAKP